MDPAPVEVIRKKLDAPNEAARFAALVHAAAHGEAARSLAAKVASMLEDVSPAVQRQATVAFRSIGAGAVDAAPILLALRTRKAPPMLVDRATFCLGCIGPAAREAAPALKAELCESPAAKDLIEALWRIVPDDSDVVDAVITAAFSPEFTDYLAASRLVTDADGPVLDRIFAEIAARTESPLPHERTRAAQLVADVAHKRPAAATPIIRKLLHDPAAAHGAVIALENLPKPLPFDLVASVAQVAEGDDIVAGIRALDVLAGLGAEAASAQDAFLRVIVRNMDGDPLAGEEGWRASLLSGAAKALARCCPTDRAVEPLVTWLDRLATTRNTELAEPSWYPIGEVVEALAILAPGDETVHELILSAVAAAQTRIDEDESSVLDFHRSVRCAFEGMTNADAMFARAAALGMPRVDPYEEDGAGEEAPDWLPEFPADDEVEEQARAEPLDETERSEIAAESAAGRRFLGLDENADEESVATAVDGWLRRVRRERAAPSEDDQIMVALTYGEAVASATGWRWIRYCWRDQKHVALASPDEAHACLPLAFIASQVSGKGVAALLLFNMLADGELPDARSGQLSVLG